MGCTFGSMFGLAPPTIVFANPEFCKLTEFLLVGHPQPNHNPNPTLLSWSWLGWWVDGWGRSRSISVPRCN
jgi:hypothetical protein